MSVSTLHSPTDTSNTTDTLQVAPPGEWMQTHIQWQQLTLCWAVPTHSQTNIEYHPYLPHYKSSTALSHMHHLICGISSLLHSVNLIVFTVLLVHLILRISPHHSHHLSSHHLSLRRPFTPDLKLISFTNPFLHSHSYSFRTDFTDLNLYCIKGALAFVCFSFWLHVLD